MADVLFCSGGVWAIAGVAGKIKCYIVLEVYLFFEKDQDGRRSRRPLAWGYLHPPMHTRYGMPESEPERSVSKGESTL